MKKLTTRGFTLIELLVVIAIIALLSSIVLASLKSARDKAKASSLVSTMVQIKTAAELYRNTSSSYPTSISQLVPKYLTATPTDPFGTGATFTISTENAGSDWCGSHPANPSQAEKGNFYIYTIYPYPYKIPTKLFSEYIADYYGVTVYDGIQQIGMAMMPCVD